VRLRFLTSRLRIVLFLVILDAILCTPVTIAALFDVNGTVISLLVGSSLAFLFLSWFAILPMIARQEITIEPDLVRIQRTWFRVPLGEPMIYPRNCLTDLRGYFLAHGGARQQTCVLNVSYNGRSIELERAFPSGSVQQLKRGLVQYDVNFVVTMPERERETQTVFHLR